MDGYGLKKDLTKMFYKAVAGVALAGALIGGTIVYVATHAGGDHAAPATPTATQKAPAPK